MRFINVLLTYLLITLYIYKIKKSQRPRSQLTKYCQIITSGGIFSCISAMHGRVSIKLIISAHYQVHVTLMTSQGQVHRHFPKMHFSGGGTPIDGSPSKII